MAQALYRKYRSKSLDEVVGQDHITKTLTLAIKKGKINHAYLFTGPKGTGKTSIARILAHEVNKLSYDEGSQHLDIIEIDAASNRRIDDIRDLRDKVHIAPSSAAYKVYIIDEVHMLTGESFNALLKTLEEPPAHVIFILATTEVQKLPATIISRAQRFHFRPIAKQKVVEHLRYIADQEQIAIDDAALAMIAERGEGGLRDSISLLDQLSSMSEAPITAEFVEKVLGLAPHDALESLLQAVRSGDAQAIYNVLEQLDEQGVAATTLSNQFIGKVMNDPRLSSEMVELIDGLLAVGKSLQPKVKLYITLLANKPSLSESPAKTARTAPIMATPPVELKKAAPKEITQQKKTPITQKSNRADAPADPAAQLPSEGGKPFTIASWPAVLSAMHAANPPIHSVLKCAKAECHDGQLILTFGFKLHQKKMADQKYRIKLVNAIIGLGFTCPKIEVTFGAVDEADFVAEAAIDGVVDATSASVLAMMGGGEAVNA